MAEEEKKKLKVENNSMITNQTSLTKFIQVPPSFEQAYLNWLIDTYQPIVLCDYKSFREMCRSLNGKTIVIGREKYATYSQEKLQVCG